MRVFIIDSKEYEDGDAPETVTYSYTVPGAAVEHAIGTCGFRLLNVQRFEFHGCNVVFGNFGDISGNIFGAVAGPHEDVAEYVARIFSNQKMVNFITKKADGTPRPLV